MSKAIGKLKLYFMSKSKAGQWSVRFGIILVVSLVLSLIFAIAIGGNPDVVAGSQSLAILAGVLSVIFTLAGPLSFFTALYAMIRHKDWSVLKPLAILYGLTLILFLSGEFLFPH